MAKSSAVMAIASYWVAFARIRFFRLSMREKILMVLFIGALLGVWFSFQMERHGTARYDIRVANFTAQNQGKEIASQGTTAEQYNALIKDINLSKLPSVNEVNARIDDLIRKYGFADFKINPPRSSVGRPLSFHTFTIDLGKANYNRLIEFTNEIKTSLPYVSLQQITIQAQRRTPQFLDVKLELKSIEYTP
jgi:hypothetical protein